MRTLSTTFSLFIFITVVWMFAYLIDFHKMIDNGVKVQPRLDVEAVLRKCRKNATTIEKRFPDIIGIGIGKCGTGATAKFLSQHPNIHSVIPVETKFFNQHYEQGAPYYLNLMPFATEKEFIFEKTPNYFWDGDFTIQRIKSMLPNVKLILSLCNPTSRAFSAYAQSFLDESKDPKNFPNVFEKNVRTNIENIANIMKSNRTLQEILDHFRSEQDFLSKRVIWQGLYGPMLNKWTSAFEHDKLLIINGDRWLDDPGKTMIQIQKFLGVPMRIHPSDFERKDNAFYCLKASYFQRTGQENDFCLGPSKGRTRNGKLNMTKATHQLLHNFYHEFNHFLPKNLNLTY